MRLSPRGHRRRVALAFAVAGLPCLLLLVLAWRMLAQEGEIRNSREQQRRADLVDRITNRLEQRLHRVRLELSAGADPDPRPVLVALRTGSSLRLPWDAARSEDYDAWPSSKAMRKRISEGERKELIEQDPAAAAVEYRRAMAAGGDNAETAYATLLLARALQRSGEQEEAREHYRVIARLAPKVRDDQRIPFALYALERLAAAGERRLVAELLPAHLDRAVELPATALHLAADIAAEIADPALTARVTERLQRIVRGTELRRDINVVLPSHRGDAPFAGWAAYGDWLWLVGSATIDRQQAVFAVRSEDLARALVTEDPSLQGLQLTHGWAHGAQMAGAAFPGLGIRLPKLPIADADAARSRRSFLLAALAFVLATSLFAAALLLRDVRREVQLAELRSQFVSSVSHELKTPLSSIRMFAESLRMGRPSSEQRRDEYLEIIVNESERLSRLLDNVLELSKIERGERRYRLEQHDLGEVVRNALRAAEYPLQQKGFRLNLQLEERLPPVRVDEDAVEQALLNLLTNAMKYSGESRDLEVRVERDGARVALRVIDQGIGVPPHEAEKIFEKFYRATNSEGVTGAGLGLAIVVHVARSHGGSVLLESRPGGGSRFTIAFPAEAV